MKRQIFLFMIIILSVGMITVNAQNGATNVDIQNNNVNISATENIRLSTGASGKVYYNNDEVAVKSETARSATIVIAAANASGKSKAGADYICSGNNDEDIIADAINSLPESGGKIQFTEGDFMFGKSLRFSNQKSILFSGYGDATRMLPQNNMFEPYYGMFYINSAGRLSFDNICFDGLNIGGVKGIHEDAPIIGIRVSNCSFLNLEDSFRLDVKADYIFFTNCIVKNSRRPLLFASDIFVSNISITQTKATQESMYICPESDKAIVTNVTADKAIRTKGKGVMFLNNNVGSFELLSGSSYCLLSNNIMKTGILNYGTNNTIVNNYIVP